MTGEKSRDSGQNRVVVGISGASGAAYGIRLLDALAELGAESHLVISKAGEMAIGYETGLSPKAVAAKAGRVYAAGDVGAAIASGSFRTAGMVIAPCSVRSWSEIASGVTSSLLTRAADVTLKERRKLILLVRETPLHAGHLRTLGQLADMGAIVMPPVPAFYAMPETVSDIVDQTVGHVLDLLGYDWPNARRWGEDRGKGTKRAKATKQP
ncbi:MAG: UbiX family flavin prenyltransferase [Alphaproteobacteria bacterium]|nr:UbiX family flavin prenyltransferase [Alphaproteobacteria bacterium]MDE2014844.1 UbiX family flavin prenyltransferase [Alphaproteobacteria bacterium]MDE2075145.1 UbiX family flavin prenyltransferase [Alphaproteobacteria bacterium]